MDSVLPKMDSVLPSNTKVSIVLIIMTGLVFVALFVSAACIGAKRAEEETVQVCLQQGIDPECCRFPKTCEVHE